LSYEDLLIEAEDSGLIVKEKPLPLSDGRIKGNRIAIRQDIPTLAEKACVLAEELGHYHTASGDILDQSSVANRKQERYGRVHAYNRLVGLIGLIDVYKHHCESLYDAAEHLHVSEDFLAESISYYRSKYGVCTTVDNYVVYFEPHIGVLELK